MRRRRPSQSEPIFSFHWTFFEVLSGLGDHNFIRKRTFVVQIFGLVPCMEHLVDRKRRLIHTFDSFLYSKTFPQKQTAAFVSSGFEAILFNLYHPLILFKLSDNAFRSWKQKSYDAERLDKKHTIDLPPHILRRLLCDNKSSFSARKRTQFRCENVVNYLLLCSFPSNKNARH